MNMKIMYVIARLDNQGPVNQLYSLVKWIDRSKVDIEIVTLYPEKKETRWEDFKQIGIKMKSLNIGSKLNIIYGSKMLEEIVRLSMPDIIHSTTLPADLVVGISNIDRMKWCTTLHCDIYTDYSLRFGKYFGYVCTKAHEYSLKRVRKAICCSESISRKYMIKFANKISVIKNGTDISDISKVMNIEKVEIRKKLKLDTSKKIVVVVGSIDERKNSKFLLDIFLKLRCRNLLQIIFLGEGPLLEKCKKIAQGKVIFKGKVNNIPLYLRCADVYISASMSEGLPLSVIEAGCYGKNMILSDIASHREIFENCHLEGITIIPLGNEKMWIETIDSIVLDDIKNEKNISQFFSLKYSAQAMAESYLKQYKELACK